MSLRLFNTLSMQKEPFEPLETGKVRMYVCGVTVYDLCHVGHARSAIVFDTIYRYLKHKGYDVTYVRNFTDVDDKIIKRANEEGVECSVITQRYIDAFYEDMDRLNIARPEEEPRATEDRNINAMIQMIESLEDQGKAYAVDGDVYFAVREFPDYGKLSKRNIEDLQSGARVDVDERKRDPLDFALWKKSKPGEPAWSTARWGKGRPGWHIECSAMSGRLLGDTFDIHGGGKDLVFPHHENEIAQSEGCTGKPFVKYWLHNGFVNINKEKMSKSLGNFFTIRDILKQYHPEVLRLFLLLSHYRSPIDFADQYLEDAKKMLDRFYDFLEAREKSRPGYKGPADGPLRARFEDAMNDDFNSALALGHMNEELRRLNKLQADLDPEAPEWKDFDRDAATLIECSRVLGLLFLSPEEYRQESVATRTEGKNLDVSLIESLITQRTNARKAKDWAAADQARDELTGMGILLEDTPEGTIWKVK